MQKPRSGEEIEYSENELNMGFIAENSRALFSDTQSISDSNSMKFNTLKLPNKDDEKRSMSDFENISLQEQRDYSPFLSACISPFALKPIKRNTPCMSQEEYEEEPIERLSKKKMNQKMKLLTLNSKKQGYQLRSRTTTYNQSSQEQYQNLIALMDTKPIKNFQKKNK